MDSSSSGRDPWLTRLVGIIAAVCVVWLVRAAAIVTIPLATAFFVAIVLHPVQIFLRERLAPHRWAAVALTMALLAVIVGGTLWATIESLDEASEALPRYSDRAASLWRSAQEAARGWGLPIPENVLASADVQQRLGSAAESAIRIVWTIASGLVIVFFLVLLMLIEAPAWGENIRRLLRGGRGRVAVETVGEIAAKVRQYLYVRTILGLMSATAAGAWLLLLDVDLVLVWVVLTFALNYIPNIGSIIAVVPPSLMALLQHGPWYGLLTLGGLTVFEQVIGNFIDPRMQGRRLRISPVVILVALLFWSWVWGPVGALLAVPMTVTLLAAAAHVAALRPLALMLGAGEEDA